MMVNIRDGNVLREDLLQTSVLATATTTATTTIAATTSSSSSAAAAASTTSTTITDTRAHSSASTAAFTDSTTSTTMNDENTLLLDNDAMNFSSYASGNMEESFLVADNSTNNNAGSNSNSNDSLLKTIVSYSNITIDHDNSVKLSTTEAFNKPSSVNKTDLEYYENYMADINTYIMTVLSAKLFSKVYCTY